jgi:hypothetical protein
VSWTRALKKLVALLGMIWKFSIYMSDSYHILVYLCQCCLTVMNLLRHKNKQFLYSTWYLRCQIFKVHVICFGFLQNVDRQGGRLVWRGLRMRCSVLPSKITFLRCEHYEQCVRVTMEWTPPLRMFFDRWIPACHPVALIKP